MPRGRSTQTFEGETEVWLRELDLERGELVGPETVIWTRTQYRAVWAEAPHLYHRDGWFYLRDRRGRHGLRALGDGRSIARHRGSRTCPARATRSSPTGTSATGPRCSTVGHADLVRGRTTGDWWMVDARHPSDRRSHVLGRETHLARVTWEDDWPVVNPGSRGARRAGRARRAPGVRTGSRRSHDFLSVRGFAGFADPAAIGLRLRSTGEAFGGDAAGLAALLRRLTSIDCVGDRRTRLASIRMRWPA